MAANTAPPMIERPSAVKVLLGDAGLSLAGAGLLYPVLLFAVGFLVSSEAGGVAESSRAGAMVSVSVLLLTFAAPLWLSGPHSLIGRMLVFGVLAAAVFAGYLAEGFWHKTISAEKAGPLTAIAIGFVLILFSFGWLLRCLGAGRAAQYGAGALVGALLIGTIPLTLPLLKQFRDKAARRTAIEWVARANPIIAGFETVEFKGWMRSNAGGFADYNTGEEFAAELGAGEAVDPPAAPAATDEKGKPKLLFSDEEVKRSARAVSGVAPPAPIWLKSAPLLTVAGAAVWSLAALIGWIRQRRARARAAAGGG